MLSRAADAIYWLNRYMERAENFARFLDVNLQLALDTRWELPEQWKPLLEASGDEELFKTLWGESTAENVTRFIVADERNPSSIVSCIRAARENARTVREMMSSEMWLHINRFYLTLNETISAGQRVENNAEFLGWIKENCALHVGLMDGSMSHTEAWHFGMLGRCLERADKTARLLDIKYFYLLPHPQDVGTEIDLLQWQAVLRSTSALEMYRRSHGHVTPISVADFLILDAHFPRSIRFCLTQAEVSLRSLTEGGGSFRNDAEKRIGAFRSELDYRTITDIFAAGLHEFLDTIEIRLNDIGDSIHSLYFTPGPSAATLAEAARAAEEQMQQ